MIRHREAFSSGPFHMVWLAMAVFALLFNSAVIRGQLPIKPFSADEVHTMRGKTTTGKVYMTENAMRFEGEERGKKSIVITRIDRKVIWTLVPDEKKYVEMPFMSTADITASAQGAQVEREPLGSEQVGSYHCNKSRVHVTYQGRTLPTYLEWGAKELDGFVVKKQDEKGSWMTEYQNIKLAPQDPSLFEVPAGYEKMSVFGGFRVPHP